LDGPAGRIPIIAMTANVAQGFAAECRAAGMDDYVSKPINRRSLKEALARCARAAEAAQAGPGEAAAAAAAPLPDDPGPLFDEAQIDELVEMFGPEDFRDLLDQLREDGTARLARMACSAAAADAAGLAEEAHAFKSGAGSAGLCAAHRLAAALEGSAREGRTDGADAALERLEAVFTGSLDRLAVRCTKAGPARAMAG
jgi:HPt (histidine-containing phosphotransfer) domain-containing protein